MLIQETTNTVITYLNECDIEFYSQYICVQYTFTDAEQGTGLYVKGMNHPWKIVEEIVPLALVPFLPLLVLLIRSNKIYIDAQVLSRCDRVQLIFIMI